MILINTIPVDNVLVGLGLKRHNALSKILKGQGVIKPFQSLSLKGSAKKPIKFM